MSIRKDDKVILLSGGDRGKTGKVLKVMPKEGRVIVEGVNMRKRRQRPKKEGQKGQTVEVAFPVAVSKVALVCPNCSSKTRMLHKITGEKKVRICKKCKAEI